MYAKFDKSETFTLAVIASDKTFYSARAKNLIINTLDGQMSFLPHHQEVIVAMTPGELAIQKPDSTWIHVVAGAGSMMFANNRATVLVDTCETEAELDERRAREALERAEDRMRQRLSLREYRLTQAAMARALSRLRFKGKEYRN